MSATAATPTAKALLALGLRLYAYPTDIAAVRDALFEIAGDVRRLERALDDIVANAREEAAALEAAPVRHGFRVIEGGRR